LFEEVHAAPFEKFPLVRKKFSGGRVFFEGTDPRRKVDTDFRISDTPLMEEFRNRKNPATDKPFKTGQAEESSYPASIEKMSDRWREIQQEQQEQVKGGFIQRNYLAFGIGIGILIIAFLIVIGGFAFLVWNAR
jgi:hypothetical protein